MAIVIKKIITQNQTAITVVCMYISDANDTAFTDTLVNITSASHLPQGTTFGGKTYTGFRVKWAGMSAWSPVAVVAGGNGSSIWQAPVTSALPSGNAEVPLFGIDASGCRARDFEETSVHGAHLVRAAATGNLNFKYRPSGTATTPQDHIMVYVSLELS